MKNKKKILIMILSTVFTVILAISFTYAFFYYGKEGSTITLESGSISLKLEEDANFLTLHDTYPKSDNIGMISTNYYDFTVVGSKGKNDDILYEIQIEQMEDNTLAEEYVKVYLTDQEDNYVASNPKTLIDLETSKYNKNRVIFSDYIYKENQEADYRLRVWVDEKYTKNVQETFNFRLVLYAINTEEGNLLYKIVEESLADYLLPENNYNTRMISASRNDENLKNYVWYSGKLWRIVALNNQSIKMITANTITSIAWGPTTKYEDSYINEWLNTVFLDTLYNSEKILVNDYPWNASKMSSANESLIHLSVVNNPVGILNLSEYNTSCNPIGYSDCYLNIGYGWWTITPYDNEKIWRINNDGDITNTAAKGDYIIQGIPVRPVINLKSDVLVSGGDGTYENPYRIKFDLEEVKENDKLNSRISGEYVNFDNKIYRIVGTETVNGNLITKVTKDQLDRVQTVVFSKEFSENNGIGLYLKNWYEGQGITNKEYKNMIATKDEGVSWYEGELANVFDYRNSFIGEKISATIGMPAYGELFSTSRNKYGFTGGFVYEWWLITKSNSLRMALLNNNLIEYSNSGNSKYFHPSFYLKSDVRIGDVDGDGDFGDGTINHPYEIYMD